MDILHVYDNDHVIFPVNNLCALHVLLPPHIFDKVFLSPVEPHKHVCPHGSHIIRRVLMGIRGNALLPLLFKLRYPLTHVRVRSVEYDDGRIFLHTDSDTLEYSYLPSLLIDPRILPFLSEQPLGVEHPHSFEVRGDLDFLIDLYREASALTGAVLFIEPERQFLLEKGISLGSEFIDGMPSLRLPNFDSWKNALAFLLRSDHGYPPRVFLENMYYSARVAVDLSSVERVRLPPEALRVVLDLNIDPTTILSGDGIILPASRVRPTVDIPFSYPSTDPVLRSRHGGFVTVSSESVIPLSDAEILGVPYIVLRPIYSSSSSPGILQRSLSHLLDLFTRFFRKVRPRSGRIDEIAARSASSDVVSAYAYMEAISRILLPLSSFLASTNALTPIGRINYLTALELYRREPNTYKRLYADNPLCSHVSNALEYFLLALSSLPLELPRWWRFPRA